jgi:hypothetical protein
MLDLTPLMTHIILPGDSNKSIHSQPLGLVPQHEVKATVATLRAHMHLFEVKGPSEKYLFTIPLVPGRRDFCCLYQVKVPASS